MLAPLAGWLLPFALVAPAAARAVAGGSMARIEVSAEGQLRSGASGEAPGGASLGIQLAAVSQSIAAVQNDIKSAEEQLAETGLAMQRAGPADALKVMVFGASFCSADNPKVWDPTGCGFRCSLRQRLQEVYGRQVTMLGRKLTGNHTETMHECYSCARAVNLTQHVIEARDEFLDHPPDVAVLHCCYCSFCQLVNGHLDVRHLSYRDDVPDVPGTVLKEVADLVAAMRANWPKVRVLISTLGLSSGWACASPATLDTFNARLLGHAWPAEVAVVDVREQYGKSVQGCELWGKNEHRDCFHPGTSSYQSQGSVYADAVAKVMGLHPAGI